MKSEGELSVPILVEASGLNMSYYRVCGMNRSEDKSIKKTKKSCDICRAEISAGEEYTFHSKQLCVECSMNIRSPRIQKPHWQYLRSI